MSSTHTTEKLAEEGRRLRPVSWHGTGVRLNGVRRGPAALDLGGWRERWSILLSMPLNCSTHLLSAQYITSVENPPSERVTIVNFEDSFRAGQLPS